MSITQTVRCDDCNRLLLEGANRMPVIITMTVDVQAGPDKPPRIHHLHFCKDACIGSWLTKQAAAKLDAAVNKVAEKHDIPAVAHDIGQHASRKVGRKINADAR